MMRSPLSAIIGTQRGRQSPAGCGQITLRVAGCAVNHGEVTDLNAKTSYKKWITIQSFSLNVQKMDIEVDKNWTKSG